MTVTADIALKITARESLSSYSEVVGSIGATAELTDTQTLNASSTVPATKAFSAQLDLSAGLYDIDLTALTDAINAALDMTGLKVQALGIVAASANTAAVQCEAHATNGYELLAAADGLVEVQPGMSIFMTFGDNAPDVGAAAKVLSLTSSDVDAIVDVLIIAG